MMRRRDLALGMGALLLAGAAHAQTPPPAAAAPPPAPATPPKAPSVPRGAAPKGPPPPAPFGMTLPDTKDLPYIPVEQVPNYRQMMRDVVLPISAYGRQRKPGFIVLARNGSGLLIKEKREWDWQSLRDPDGATAGKYTPQGSLDRAFLQAIDGMVIDAPVFGRPAYGAATGMADVLPLLNAARALRESGRHNLAIDYTQKPDEYAAAWKRDVDAGMMPFIDDGGSYRLDRIPASLPPAENAAIIRALDQARNYLPMLGSGSYASRPEWVRALAATNYDMLILDPFYRGSDSLTTDDMRRLRYKRLGADRLLLANIPMARASSNRFYWQAGWAVGNPPYLYAPNPSDDAQVIVQYWDPAWKAILGKYIQGICDLGFDGVVLDQLDTYLYFEALSPLS